MTSLEEVREKKNKNSNFLNYNPPQEVLIYITKNSYNHLCQLQFQLKYIFFKFNYHP